MAKIQYGVKPDIKKYAHNTKWTICAIGPNRIGPSQIGPSRTGLSRAFSCPLAYCWCGRPFDYFAHHRAACSVEGILGKRWFAAARVCREARARVRTNVMVLREMDLVPDRPCTLCAFVLLCGHFVGRGSPVEGGLWFQGGFKPNLLWYQRGQ